MVSVSVGHKHVGDLVGCHVVLSQPRFEGAVAPGELLVYKVTPHGTPCGPTYPVLVAT